MASASPDPKYVRSLVRLARGADGRIDPERVGAILQALAKNPPRNHRAVLRAFHAGVARELARSEAVIEYAGELTAAALAPIQATLEAHYGRSLTLRPVPRPDLLAGFRARVADDLWDASATGRLALLERSLSA